MDFTKFFLFVYISGCCGWCNFGAAEKAELRAEMEAARAMAEEIQQQIQQQDQQRREDAERQLEEQKDALLRLQEKMARIKQKLQALRATGYSTDGELILNLIERKSPILISGSGEFLHTLGLEAPCVVQLYYAPGREWGFYVNNLGNEYLSFNLENELQVLAKGVDWQSQDFTLSKVGEELTIRVKKSYSYDAIDVPTDGRSRLVNSHSDNLEEILKLDSTKDVMVEFYDKDGRKIVDYVKRNQVKSLRPLVQLPVVGFTRGADGAGHRFLFRDYAAIEAKEVFPVNINLAFDPSGQDELENLVGYEVSTVFVKRGDSSFVADITLAGANATVPILTETETGEFKLKTEGQNGSYSYHGQENSYELSIYFSNPQRPGEVHEKRVVCFGGKLHLI